MHWQQSVGGVDLMTLSFSSGNLDVTGAITAGTKDFKTTIRSIPPTNTSTTDQSSLRR
jgi:hypothetical protein